MNEASLNELLESLGLTEYESKTLSTLFELEEAEAPEISRLSQVPKTRVYDVLDKLVGRNLVIEIRGRPKRYRVLDAKSVLNALVGERKRELEAIERRAKEVAGSLSLPGKGAALGSEMVMRVKDVRDFERILSREIGRAESSVLGFAEITSKHNVLVEAIARAREKNVSVRILNAFPEGIVKRAARELRHLEHGLNAFIIDGKRVVMGLSDFKRQLPEYHFAIWRENKPVANALRHYFDKLWQRGKKI